MSVCVAVLRNLIQPVKVRWLIYIPTGLTFRNNTSSHTGRLCILYGAQNKRRLFLFTRRIDWFYDG